MNLEITNAMFGYIETLYTMNQNLIKLCGATIYVSGIAKYKEITLNIIQDIPRLIPYCSENGHLKIKESLRINRIFK